MKTVEEQQTITADQLLASICRDSFFEFVRRFWDVVVPEDPVYNFHIEVMCSELQYVAERVFQSKPKEHDLLINVPPGSTKSTICSIMFPAWAFTRMPAFRSICGSYSYPLQLELSRRCRDIVQSELYQRLWPELKLREDQNTKGFFANVSGGSRYATSTGGSVTGFHGHVLIVDDPLDPQSAVSEPELKKANDWISRTLSTRKVDKTVTPTILIMQRLHEEDPSQDMLDKAKEGKTKVRHINLPAEISHENSKEVRPRSLRRMYTPDPELDGYKLLDPIRMNRTVLSESLPRLGEYGYAGQFLQRPVPLGGGMFKVERIEVDVPPSSSTDWKMKVRYWDKAGTKGGGAFTAGVLMGEDKNGLIWVLDVKREQLDSAAREQLIKSTAKIDGVGVQVGVEQEPGSGGKESAENTVRNLKGWNVEVNRPTGDKAQRADPFSTQVNARNVRLARGEWNQIYVNELALFPNSKYKDQVDASSGAFSVLAFSAQGRAGVW